MTLCTHAVAKTICVMSTVDPPVKIHSLNQLHVPSHTVLVYAPFSLTPLLLHQLKVSSLLSLSLF